MATQITALPIPPSRQDPANFSARADAFLGALPTFRTEANLLATEAEQDALTASNAATSASNSAASALASRNAAEAAFDSFDDRYLGAKNANPTVDNDGQPLLTGALYYNTVVPEMRVYTGTAWVTASTVGGTVNNLTVLNTFVPPDNSIALGTKTTGNYAASVAVSGGGLSVTATVPAGFSVGENATFTIASNAVSTNTANALVIRDGSGNFTAGTITASLNGNATTASNSSQLNGFASDINGTANTIARRDANGYLYSTYFVQSSGEETPTVAQVIVTNGNDGFLRKAPLSHIINSINQGPGTLRFVERTGGNSPRYSARAFVNFNGSPLSIRASQNISSIERLGAGSYRITFSTAMQDASYTAVFTGGLVPNGDTSGSSIVSTTSTQVVVQAGKQIGQPAQDSTQCHLVIFE